MLLCFVIVLVTKNQQLIIGQSVNHRINQSME